MLPGYVFAAICAAAVVAAACAGSSFDDPRLEQFEETNGPHVAAGQMVPRTAYASLPPTFGPMDPAPIACGVYRGMLRFERTVHTMEHGAVIWYYQPGRVGSEVVEAMHEQALALVTDGSELVFTPNSEITDPIALTAWGRLLRLDRYEPETIGAFVNAFAGRVGPERRIGC